MKIVIIMLSLGLGYIVNAQKIDYKGVIYEVKNEKVFKENVDVTETLSSEEKEQIKITLNKKIAALETSEETAKKLEKEEKERRKIEKKHKKIEKELKKKEKAQSNFDRATRKHKEAVSRYGKLKKRGKLSPQKEAKWVEKIEKLKRKTIKTENKLRWI